MNTEEREAIAGRVVSHFVRTERKDITWEDVCAHVFNPGVIADCREEDTAAILALSLSKLGIVNPDTVYPAASPQAAITWEWAIVEIMGFRRHAGRCRELMKFGESMIQVDVPTGVTEEWVTHFYPGRSVFSYSPTTEQTVREQNGLDDDRQDAFEVVEAAPRAMGAGEFVTYPDGSKGFALTNPAADDKPF